MKPLSVHARESIKTGLAMSITIGIALRMEFLEPSWAGFAVAMISLDSAGQSLNKAALRMLGTLLAFVASLAFVGLFPQQRWAMLLALTPYIGICTYMIAGNKRPYAWFVAAFVCLTIMVHAGADSESMFRYAVARVEETALGILVYSLVSIFLWPRTSRGDLQAASRALFDTQLRLFRAHRGLLAGEGSDEDSRPLRLQELQRLTQLGQALTAAETDSYQVWELRHAWRRFLQQSTLLAECYGRWRMSLPEVRSLDLTRLLPGLDASLAEIDRRFEQVARMLSGAEADSLPQTVELASEQRELQTLTHFQRAAVALFVTQVRQLDEVSRGIFDCVHDTAGAGRIVSKPLRGAARPRSLAFDADRFRSVCTVVAAMWTGFALWIWVDPPGHASFAYKATLWAMLAVLARTGASSLFPGSLLGLGVGGIAYVGVMPHLSGYLELGLMMFVATAGGFYLLSEPRMRGTRSMYVAMLLIATSISNEQTYSFSSYANSVASTLLTIALASVVGYFPSSPRPEKVFLRQLARYFRHAEMLMSHLAPNPDHEMGLVERLRRAWYRSDLLELPEKLVAVVEQIDYRLLPGTTPEQARALVTNLHSVTLRIQELLDAREHVEPDPRLEEIVAELREWREVGGRQFRAWADDPSATLDPATRTSERLHARLARIEAKIEAARERAGTQEVRVEYGPIYRYLGALRGVAEATLGYAGVAAAVNWEPWQEARF